MPRKKKGRIHKWQNCKRKKGIKLRTLLTIPELQTGESDMSSKKIQNMIPNSGHVLVTETNLVQGIIFKKPDLLSSINCWHKFIINNTENSTRNEVLGAVLDHVHPLDLIPVSFWKDKYSSYFLARNCGPAIQKLCNDNLVVPSSSRGRPYKLSIILKFATTGEFKVDVQKNILKVLTKRHDLNTRTLNLVKFHEDPDLLEFCPLSQPKIMFFVLHLTKSLVPPPENYIMSNNRIKLLNALEAITSTSAYVKCLDLSNNLLSSFDTLDILKQFKIKELYLDENPLCENISSEEYVSKIKKFKSLTSLDGISLKSGPFPIPRKVFLCNLDGAHLVNRFLEHYFFIYDSQNRKLIKELYDKNAMFSLNSTYHNSSLSSATTRLYKYNNISRNLIKMADMDKTYRNLYRGRIEIANVLCDLPATEHDPYSFVVDLIYYTSTCAIVGISGVFREVPQTLLETEKLYGFRRIFTLEQIDGSGLINIINEEFHVHNALSWQVLDSFRVVTKTSAPVTVATATPQSEEECQKATETLKVITTLNSAWAKKCLEECNYDLKRALALFVDLYKQNRIPEEGFQKQV